jgi:hypothetical protein
MDAPNDKRLSVTNSTGIPKYAVRPLRIHRLRRLTFRTTGGQASQFTSQADVSLGRSYGCGCRKLCHLMRGGLCATRRCFTGGGARPSRSLSQQGPGSWGQSGPGGAGRGWEQPRRGSGSAGLPDALGALARREGTAVANECLMPRDSKTARNLADMGWCSAGAAEVGGGSAPVSSSLCGLGDREEGLRRTRGDAAGVKLGPAPVDRWAVNVGSVWASPYLPGIQPGGGQAHRPLTVPGCGRALVVVRRRESRRHGEGGQQVCGRA